MTAQTSDIQIFDIDKIEDMVKNGTSEYSSIYIYRGFISPDSKTAVLQRQMKPVTGKKGKNFGGAWSWIKENMSGDFTFVTKPYNEMFYVRNFIDTEGGDPINMLTFSGESINTSLQAQTPQSIREIVDENVRLKLELEKLKGELKHSREKLAEQGTLEYKMSRVIGTVYSKIMGEEEEQDETINSAMAIPIEEQIAITSEMDNLQVAWAKLHNMFGEETLIRMVAKLEREPDKIQMIKSFL